MSPPSSSQHRVTRPNICTARGDTAGSLRVRAVLTAHEMAAESRRAAALDRRHHLQLSEADVTGIGVSMSELALPVTHLAYGESQNDAGKRSKNSHEERVTEHQSDNGRPVRNQA